ncbi:MAG TPA: aminotransferase class V-fold PLP-dependent enzyme [Actinomycetota bacterium]
MDLPWPDHAAVRAQWPLDPAVTFLNHGSFGACPSPVLEEQSRWRALLERQPVAFFESALAGHLAHARARVAGFLGAEEDGLVFLPNTTTGVNTVLKGLALGPGDEVVFTDHAYPAVDNLIRTLCADTGADFACVPLPLPLPEPDAIVAAVMDAVTERTRVVVVDQVTSATAAILPVERIVRECRSRGVLSLVDAAHAPAMLPVDLRALDADFWVGNFHKWLCAPKGAAGLVVRAEHRTRLTPLVTSHAHLTGFQAPFDWTGTHDPTAILSVPAAIDFLGGLGFERIRAYGHALALAARDGLAEAFGTEPLVPEPALGMMASIELPRGLVATREHAWALHDRVVAETALELPFNAWNGRGIVRVSCHAYNHPDEVERLLRDLPAVLARA